MEVKHKIWLEIEGKVIFGHGRYSLLRAIDQYKSLNAAAKQLNMSYRAAWGRLKATEERLGIKLVEMDAKGGGTRLTKEAREFLDKFDRLESETQRFLKTASRKLRFPPRH